MLKVIIDYFLNQWDTISKEPSLFIVTFIIGCSFAWFVSSLMQKNRIEAFETILKLKDEQIKDKDTKIQSLEKQLASEEKYSQKSNNLNLSEVEIQTLKAISRFQKENPILPTELPSEYSVDNLIADLEIDWSDANEILKKIRRIGLVESIWDSVPLYPNLDRPINETRPVRLSKTGQEFLINSRSDE